MKILFLAHRIPFPPDKGDKIRSYQVLQYLAARHEVHLVCLIDNPRDLQAAQALRGTLPNLVYEELKPLPQRMRMLKALLNRKPLTVSYFYLPRLQAQLDALVARECFDALFVYSSTMAEYVRGSNIPKRIVDFCDLDSQKFKQYAESSLPPWSWLYHFEGKRLAAYEKEAARAFEHVLFISPEEQRLFEQNGGDTNTALMSNGVDFARYYGDALPETLSKNSPLEGGQGGVVRGDGDDELEKTHCAKNTPLTPLKGGIATGPSFSNSPLDVGQGGVALGNGDDEVEKFFCVKNTPLKGRTNTRPYLAFTGAMDYLPNVDAAHWCAREIFPMLKAILPELEFYIIGGNPARKIRKLHDPSNGIFVTGYLPDLRPLLKGARVFVAPMRIARGMQTKILEAIACGVPVVTSANAAQGIGAKPEQEVLIASTASEYARQVLRLLLNRAEHERLRREAFAFLRAKFDWQKNLAVLDELLKNPPLEGSQRGVIRCNRKVEAEKNLSSENTPLKGGMLHGGSQRSLPTRKSKIKIAHVVGRLSLGGLELEVIRLLNRLDPERYAATIIATESITPTARELVGKHLKLVALNKREGLQWHVIREIAEWCRSQRITILHSHNWTTFLYSVLAGVRANVPILIHGEHGRETHDYRPHFKQRLACQLLARRCEFITAVSDDIIPLLASSWKIPSHRIVKMPIGVALHEFDFTADRRVAKSRLGLPENAPVLGTVIGNFRPVKDLPTMLRAFQLLQRQIPQAVLAVVGGGNLHVAQQQATDIGIASSVRFLGERRDIPRVLAAFDLYVNSSLYEGMSNAILEAMAAGVPVVATQVGGTPAIVREGATGLLVPASAPEQLAEAMQRLISDEGLREKIKHTARDYVEQHHSHEHYVRLHEQMYEECCARKARINSPFEGGVVGYR